MSATKTFTEVVDGRRAWIFVHDARDQHRCSDASTPYLVAFGFGEAPSVVEAPSLLKSEAGEVRWFASIEAAAKAAREDLVRQEGSGALALVAPGEHRLRRPSGRHLRPIRLNREKPTS